jgi:Na+/H+-translocating membrane pyrophosphatase
MARDSVYGEIAGDGEAVTPALVIEHAYVLGVGQQEFTTREGKTQSYTEATILVGLEVYHATVAQGVILGALQTYPRLVVEVKGVGRMGGGHDVRFRVVGV